MKKYLNNLVYFAIFIQFVILFYMIANYTYVINFWKEYKIIPIWVDPLDVFRWNYMNFRYNISNFDFEIDDIDKSKLENYYKSRNNIYIVPKIDNNNFIVWIDKLLFDKINDNNIIKWKIQSYYLKTKYTYLFYSWTNLLSWEYVLSNNFYNTWEIVILNIPKNRLENFYIQKLKENQEYIDKYKDNQFYSIYTWTIESKKDVYSINITYWTESFFWNKDNLEKLQQEVQEKNVYAIWKKDNLGQVYIEKIIYK